MYVCGSDNSHPVSAPFKFHAVPKGVSDFRGVADRFRENIPERSHLRRIPGCSTMQIARPDKGILLCPLSCRSELLVGLGIVSAASCSFYNKITSVPLTIWLHVRNERKLCPIVSSCFTVAAKAVRGGSHEKNLHQHVRAASHGNGYSRCLRAMS